MQNMHDEIKRLFSSISVTLIGEQIFLRIKKGWICGPEHFSFFSQKFSLLHLASAKKILTPATNNENGADDSFEYIPPKVSYERDLIFYSVCIF